MDYSATALQVCGREEEKTPGYPARRGVPAGLSAAAGAPPRGWWHRDAEVHRNHSAAGAGRGYQSHGHTF